MFVDKIGASFEKAGSKSKWLVYLCFNMLTNMINFNFSNNRKSLWAIHIFVWAFLFSVPYFLSLNSFENFERLLEHTWIPLALYAISFYLNYFKLSDKLFEKDKRLSFALWNLLIIACFIAINFGVRMLFWQKMPPPEMLSTTMKLQPGMHKGPKGPMSLFMYKDIISYLIPVIFALAFRAIQRWNKAELLQKTTEKERLNSELQQLKYQLQPHFFFNSLNNIYALVDINPERAKESIHGLSKLMRYMLYESDTDRVSLKQELDFMTRYIDLMAMRCSKKTKVQYEFAENNTEILVPPLLFISLIENAFKHGVSATIETDIKFKLETNGSRIFFETSNTNLPKTEEDKSGSGIGLENLRKRLKLLFPDNYFLSGKIENERFVVKMAFSVTSPNPSQGRAK